MYTNKNIALSIEQMQKLEELGLDTSDASMFWYKNNESSNIIGEYLLIPNNGINRPFIDNGDILTYTIQDIQEILNNEATCYIVTDYACLWAESLNDNKHLIEFTSDDMLLNTYQMLVWCIENNYIKTNKV